MRNHSYENDFDLHKNETECGTHFHMKGFALRLVLKQRHKRTRKWLIVECLTPDFHCWLHNTSISEKIRLFTIIWSRWALNTYVKEQKSFHTHHRFVSDLVIKIDCFHLNLSSLRHALLDVVQSSLFDNSLSQHTGQACLTATVLSLKRTKCDRNVQILPWRRKKAIHSLLPVIFLMYKTTFKWKNLTR